MSRKLIFAVLGFALAFALGVIVPSGRAAEWNQATRFTFNQPVEIPGNMVLGPGTYWFVIPGETGVNPNVVRIYHADRTKVVATLETIPMERQDATGRSRLTFGEQAKDAPVALMDWFFPGRLTGHEFIYSPSKEATLAENGQFTVMARHDELG